MYVSAARARLYKPGKNTRCDRTRGGGYTVKSKVLGTSTVCFTKSTSSALWRLGRGRMASRDRLRLQPLWYGSMIRKWVPKRAPMIGRGRRVRLPNTTSVPLRSKSHSPSGLIDQHTRERERGRKGRQQTRACHYGRRAVRWPRRARLVVR